MRPRRVKIPAGTQRARSRGGAYPEPRIEGAGATRAEETMRKIKSIDLEHHFLGGREPRDISRVLRQKSEHSFAYSSVTSPTLSVRLFELSTSLDDLARPRSMTSTPSLDDLDARPRSMSASLARCRPKIKI